MESAIPGRYFFVFFSEQVFCFEAILHPEHPQPQPVVEELFLLKNFRKCFPAYQMQRNKIRYTMRSCKFIFSCLNNKTSYLVHEERHDPGQYGCIAGCKKWPFPASGFLPDGSKGRNTWEIKQRKEHVGKSNTARCIRK